MRPVPDKHTPHTLARRVRRRVLKALLALSVLTVTVVPAGAAAAAADSGYRVVVALLGSTNLLLEQNHSRLIHSLGLDHRQDYRWVVMVNPAGAAKTKELANWLSRGRTILVPVLKHAGRISALAKALSAVDDDLPVLIIDDEADQAPLVRLPRPEALAGEQQVLRALRPHRRSE